MKFLYLSIINAEHVCYLLVSGSSSVHYSNQESSPLDWKKELLSNYILTVHLHNPKRSANIEIRERFILIFHTMKSRPLISFPLQQLHIMCTPTSLLFVNSDCWRARNAVFNFYSPYYVKAKLKRPTKPIPARFRLDHAHTTDTASVLQGVLRDLCWSWKHAKGKVPWEVKKCN